MSLKRILGTMLASRMAGHGRRRGGLGSASILGGLGRRRSSGLGGKLGVAALGYMAYKAYQSQQSQSGGARATANTGAKPRSDGGILGMVQDAVAKMTGEGGQAGSGAAGAQADEAAYREEAEAAERMSEDTALLLIRAMICAAYADGSLSTAERERIMGQIDEAGGTEEDRAILEREVANPKPLGDLLAQVSDEDTAEEFYLASRAAVDPESPANRAHLDEVRRRLDLSQDQVAQIEEVA